MANEQNNELPENPEEAFIKYEDRMYQKMISEVDDTGFFAKDDYIAAIRAFVDEYNLDIQLPQFNHEFEDYSVFFNSFRNIVQYWKHRFSLRRTKKDTTPPIRVELNDDFKSTMHYHIDKIRKIVNSSDLPTDKKDAIYKRLSSLSVEIDKGRTRLDDLVRVWLTITKAAGEGFKNLDPAVTQFQRIWNIVASAPEVTDNRLEKIEPKLLVDQSPKEDKAGDDDIPF